MRTLGVCLLALKVVIFHSLKGTLILLSLLLRTSLSLLLIQRVYYTDTTPVIRNPWIGMLQTRTFHVV